MIINGREYSEPEARAYINQLEATVKRYEEREKEYKRLLKAAIGELNDGSCSKNCSKCKWNNGGCEWSDRYAWIHSDEALDLIGGEDG